MEKKKPYTEYEKQLLLQLVQSRINELDNRRTDAINSRKKLEAWESLAKEFNSSPNISQTTSSKQLKKMWQNMKTKARDAKTVKRQATKAGGGPQPPEMGSIETQVLAAMPNIMPSINVDIDSDIILLQDREAEADDDSKAWLHKTNRNKENEPESSTSTEKSSVATSKNKRKHEDDFSIEEIKKRIYLQKLKNCQEKFELEKQCMLECHKINLEILNIKKEIALKELNK